MRRIHALAVTVVLVIVGLVVVGIIGSTLSPRDANTQSARLKSRSNTIPADATKMTSEKDRSPPVLHSNLWQSPIPIPGPVNTAGAEDSPFITTDGETFFFFFTPDVRIPVEKQLIDGVTGIWWTHKTGNTWSEPERIVLNNDVSLDGCEFVQGDVMWFCSARVGNYREIDVYTAKLRDRKWTDVTNAGRELNVDSKIGEFCITPDGNTLYYGHHDGSRGIWALQKINGVWSNPHPIPNLNGDINADQPFVTPDSNELWFTWQSKLGYPGPAVFMSVREGDGWSQPTEIVSSFAGEPDLDAQGNIYFVHHFFSENGTMIEADIYVAYRNKANPTATAFDESQYGDCLHIPHSSRALASTVIPDVDQRNRIPR